MGLFGKRTPPPGSVVFIGSDQINYVETEVIRVVTGSQLLDEAVRRLRDKAADLRSGPSGLHAWIVANNYEEIADELYGIACRPWFEECK